MSGPGKYKQTLNLPSTEFQMRGDMAGREPELLAEWEEMGIYDQILASRAGADKYVLHDGPPYANGHLHHGHVLNKILKDIVVKYQTMSGRLSPYVPGWDTHGLPIELAVDRELGDKKRDLSKAEIRNACRDYALRFVDIQRTEFQRLGGFGSWDKPYLTLQHSYEAAIVRALAAFARGGFLYRGKKPVYWCPHDRTALAEAEIEYHDHVSPSIYVRFPVTDEFDPATLDPRLAGKKLALPIWTTTPWTLPANLAVVMHRGFEYVAVPSPRDPAEYFLVARALADSFLAAIGGEAEPESWIEIGKEALGTLEGVRYHHPLVPTPKSDNDFRVWFTQYVTLEQGTGLVHTAPGHGAEDYGTGVDHGLEIYAPLDDAGCFTEDVPRWVGKMATDANPDIVAHLHETGYLLNPPGESIEHSYAHCWRCKGPILFRATPQWFIDIDHNSLRQRALDEIDVTKWVPHWGKERIHGMIANRPDWCLSRQRIWGVPITAFYCTSCGESHADAETMEFVADIFAREGADAWYLREPAELMPDGTQCAKCGGGEFRAEQDIIDVWFESGCSWFAIASTHDDFADIDLYLEGSDQHRGWFHSSLLVGIGVAGKAPYKEVITHGFVLDDQGRPYSKSAIEEARRKGKKVRFVPPADFIAKNGAEMLRMWVASTEFRNDIPFADSIMKGLSDWYRKLRNTCRYMLGNLADFDPNGFPLDSVDLSDLDRYMLARLGDLVARVRHAYSNFEFHVVHRAMVDFVTGDLSSLYLDIVKDRLYSDGSNSPSRRAAQAVVYTAVRTMATLSAPIMAFTAEDIWRHIPRRNGDPVSVHLALLPEGKPLAEADELAQRWTTLLSYREAATRRLEEFRALKHKSLDAKVTIGPLPGDRDLLARQIGELADLLIVSQVVLGEDSDAAEPVITVAEHPGKRCDRCWKWSDALSIKHPDLCNRCSDVVTTFDD